MYHPPAPRTASPRNAAGRSGTAPHLPGRSGPGAGGAARPAPPGSPPAPPIPAPPPRRGPTSGRSRSGGAAESSERGAGPREPPRVSAERSGAGGGALRRALCRVPLGPPPGEGLPLRSAFGEVRAGQGRGVPAAPGLRERWPQSRRGVGGSRLAERALERRRAARLGSSGNSSVNLSDLILDAADGEGVITSLRQFAPKGDLLRCLACLRTGGRRAEPEGLRRYALLWFAIGFCSLLWKFSPLWHNSGVDAMFLRQCKYKQP